PARPVRQAVSAACSTARPTAQFWTLSLHDALPILPGDAGPCTWAWRPSCYSRRSECSPASMRHRERAAFPHAGCSSCCLSRTSRSEEHTSELQSRGHLVCRLLLEKKNNRNALYTAQ